LIERYWGFLKKRVLVNHHYETWDNQPDYWTSSFKYLLMGFTEEKRLFFADDYYREDQ
jgi:hypothetical protein